MVALIRESFQIFRALHPAHLCRYQCTLRHSLASLSLLISPTPYTRKESLVALAVLSGS